MKNNLLFIAFISCTLVIKAQSGDTINDAIVVNGADVSIDVLDFNSATVSGLMPECASTEDVFYMHTVSSGDNKVTIGMVSAGLIVLTEFDYQILVAPGGNIGSLQEVLCDSYVVPILASGSFELVIDDVNVDDVYFLRVYKPDGLGGLLSDLLTGTLITMMSEFDSTLSVAETNTNSFKFIVNDNSIKLLNNTEFNNYKVFSLDGKQMISDKSNQLLSDIDISQLNRGLYVLMLQNKRDFKTIKFVKQ